VKEDDSLGHLLRTAASHLEAGRCRAAEVEAWTCLASSILKTGNVTADTGANHPVQESKETPVSVAEAWEALQQSMDWEPQGDAEQEGEKSSRVARTLGARAAAVYTAVQASSCRRMAGAAADVLSEREAAKDVLRAVVDRKRKLPDESDAWLACLDAQLQEIRTYHAQNPTQINSKRSRGQADGYDVAGSVKEIADEVLASDRAEEEEEVFGKYLDLQHAYEYARQHCSDIVMKDNNKNTADYQYSDFLEDLSTGMSVAWKEQDKLQARKAYVRLLLELQEYLTGFLERTAPLLKIAKHVTEPAVKEFERTWSETGGAPGWHAIEAEADLVKTNQESEAPPDKPRVDLSAYSSAQELVDAVSADLLKVELSRLSLKSGGTPQQRAERLFLLKTKSLADLPRKVFAKGYGPASSETNEHVTWKQERRVDMARREVVVTALLDQVRPTLEATVRRAARRQTQTQQEREREVQEELYGTTMAAAKTKTTGDEDESDDEDAPIYNPKNVPLDWDGKPIPYWLFKLHGLNHYYPCDICGGESYRGRRNFELHFAEQKHALGMKSLGIPNTKHFHGVTKIEDAEELWKALQNKLNQEQFDGTKEEEYEDSHGNVLSRTAYEDLARQGLL
jgi:splicing factor 3A subunit 3